MALFGNLFGGRKESKKKNNWEKETSFMVVIPKMQRTLSTWNLWHRGLRSQRL